MLVPAGANHNIVNTGTVPLKLYTLYAPPNHQDGVVHHTAPMRKRTTNTSTVKQQNSESTACWARKSTDLAGWLLRSRMIRRRSGPSKLTAHDTSQAAYITQKIVAPKVGGAKLAAGSMLAADGQLASTPSVSSTPSPSSSLIMAQSTVLGKRRDRFRARCLRPSQGNRRRQRRPDAFENSECRTRRGR